MIANLRMELFDALVSGVSVIPRFIKRGHNNNCDVMYRQGDVSRCPAQCHGMQMLEGAASSLQHSSLG